MNSKVWLTVFGVFAAAVIGAAGYYCLGASAKYREALQGWDEKVSTIRSLERKVPYPNEENVETLQVSVDGYRKSVDDLFAGLNRFQKPLNKTLLSTEFQQSLSKRVGEFRGFADSGGLTIQAGAEFQLGFEAYSSSIPAPELVPMLDYELQAIDHLLRELVIAGGEELTMFSRDPIPGEPGGADASDEGVVHKYPVRLSFRSTHSAFQGFLNKIANDEDYFYILRILKVRNDLLEGPPKLTNNPEMVEFPRYINPGTMERADPVRLEEWGFPDSPKEEVQAAAEAEGFELATQDATVLMGQEKLNVFMVIDIVRVLSPAEVGAVEEKEDEPDKTPRALKVSNRYLTIFDKWTRNLGIKLS